MIGLQSNHLGSNYPIESEVCERCESKENLTKHHVKDKITFVKTGQIEILCRGCHDNEERQLESKGMLGKRVATKRRES